MTEGVEMNSDMQERQDPWKDLRVFAFDHRAQFQEMSGATGQKIGEFKLLCLRAARQVSAGRSGFGLLCDQRLGSDALAAASGTGLWIARPVEWPGSRPLKLEPDVGEDYSGLQDWPKDQIIKCLCFCHPDDDPAMWQAQEATIKSLFEAARQNNLQFLLEVIPSKVRPVTDATTAQIIQRFYDLGVRPDWWKLEPFRTDEAWQKVCDVILRNDNDVRGIVVLGLDAAPAELFDSFALAARHDLVKGFAVGRTIFGDVARAWMVGDMSDTKAVDQMAMNYSSFCESWDKARAKSKENAT